MKRRAKSFLLRSTKFRKSIFVRLKHKFIASTRSTCGYKKHGISPWIQERSSKIKGYGFRKLPTRASKLQEVRDSSHLGLLSIFCPGKEGFSFKGLFGEENWVFGFFLMFLCLGELGVLLDVSLPR